MFKKTVGGLVAALLTSGLVISAQAHPTAEDAYDYRKHLMTALKGHIGAASMILRGLVDDDGYLLHHATGLANGAAEAHRVFQEGSAVEGSEALPAVWQEPEKFAAAMQQAEEATAKFREVVAEGGDRKALLAGFRAVGNSCRGCHDDFRMQHEH